MRTTSTLALLLSGVLFVMQSCSKESQEEMVLASPSLSNETINASVLSGSAYELPVAKYGSVSISKQAQHFLESGAGVDPKTGVMLYRYVPAAGFSGDDEVVLKGVRTISTYSGGGCNRGEGMYENKSTVTSYVTIRFKVTK